MMIDSWASEWVRALKINLWKMLLSHEILRLPPLAYLGGELTIENRMHKTTAAAAKQNVVTALLSWESICHASEQEREREREREMHKRSNRKNERRISINGAAA
jgi:hypothetical protein